MQLCKQCKYFTSCGDVSRVEPCNGFEKAAPEMKTVDQIERAIDRNRAAIASAESEITALSFSVEIRNAIEAHDKPAYLKYHELEKGNAEKIAALCNKVYLLKIENMILYDNRKARIFSDILPIITAACKPFIGKQYGDKTRKKIFDQVHAAGYSFYFCGSHYDTLEFYKVDTGRGYDTGNGHIQAYSKKFEYRFIDADNRLVFDAEMVKPPTKYIDNPKAHAKKIINAYEDYKKALKKAESAQVALNALTPSCIDHYYKVSGIRETLL